MIALGVDPALAKLGFAVVELERTHTRVPFVETFQTHGEDVHERLDRIAGRTFELCKEYDVEAVGYEEQSWVMVGKREDNMNARARRVLEVTGVVRGVTFGLDLPCYGLAVSTVKKALTGKGLAKKKQMTAWAKMLVGRHRRISQHGADAVGVALATAREALKRAHQEELETNLLFGDAR